MSERPLESWRLFFPTAAALAVAGLGAWGVQFTGFPLGLVPTLATRGRHARGSPNALRVTAPRAV